MTDRSRSVPGPDTSTGLLRDLATGPAATRWDDFALRYAPFMRLKLWELSRDHPSLTPDLFDDIAQETLLFLWNGFPNGVYDRSKGTFRAFLYGVLRNKAMNAVTARNKTPAVPPEAFAEAAAAAPDDADAMRAEALRALVDRFLEGERFSGRARAIYRRLLAGEPVAALSREYGLEANAIYQLSRRIRRALAERRAALQKGGSLEDLLEALAVEAAETAPAARQERSETVVQRAPLR